MKARKATYNSNGDLYSPYTNDDEEYAYADIAEFIKAQSKLKAVDEAYEKEKAEKAAQAKIALMKAKILRYAEASSEAKLTRYSLAGAVKRAVYDGFFGDEKTAIEKVKSLFPHIDYSEPVKKKKPVFDLNRYYVTNRSMFRVKRITESYKRDCFGIAEVTHNYTLIISEGRKNNKLHISEHCYSESDTLRFDGKKIKESDPRVANYFARHPKTTLFFAPH